MTVPDGPELSQTAALELVEAVRIVPGELKVALSRGSIREALGTGKSFTEDDLQITLPFTERRRGVEMKMVVSDGAPQTDQTLLRNVALANRWYQKLKAGHSFKQIAQEFNTSKRRVQQIVELAFLAPDIVRDITKGTQSLGFTSDWCIRHALPADWQAQRERIASL